MINFKDLLKEYNDVALEKLIELCKINSIYDASTVSKAMPYGKGVNQALNFMKELALENGFNTELVGNRAIEITYGNKGKEVGIFAHLDVVPVDGVWTYGPFNPTVSNGKLFARGTSDDKGPAIAAFYGLVALKKAGLLENYRIRMVCGGDEERGSSCLDYYFNEAKKKPVDCGFTPDADFPLIYGEKGITNYILKGNIDLGENILSISAGTESNIVIPEASVTLKDSDGFVNFLKNNNVKFKHKVNVVTILGKPAHGSTPELGDNAGTKLLKYLGEFYNNDVLKLLAHSYADYNGKNLKQYYETKNMGNTTYNLGLISYDGHELKLTINFRYPENVEIDKVMNEIQNISPLPLYVLSSSEVLYFDPETPMIKTLLKVYQDETNDFTNLPMTIGGGTYAKEAKNIVAFGSKFPNKNDNIHDVDEKIDLEDFYGSMPIYAHAVYALGNTNEN